VLGPSPGFQPRLVTVVAVRSEEVTHTLDTAEPPSAVLSGCIDTFKSSGPGQAMLVGLVEARSQEHLDAARRFYSEVLQQLPIPGLYTSLAVQDLIRSVLEEDVIYDDFGIFTVPNAARSERVFAVLHPDIPMPERLSPRRLGNCPLPRRSFVGRETEIAQLQEMLQDRRLVAVVGPPGMGKSALALRTARSLSEEFPDGIWWFAVDECASLDELLERILRHEGLAGIHGARDLQRVAERIAPRKALIVLDGCDKLRASIRKLCGQLLGIAGPLTVLVTATQRLGLPGEHLLPLRPLRLEVVDGELDEFPALSPDAINLLYQRAEEIGVSLSLDDETYEHAAALCQLVDGHPLAIEVLAAALRTSSLPALRHALEDHQEGKSKQIPYPLEQLDTAIETSYAVLNASERKLLHRLALFTGSWRLDAVSFSLSDIQPDELLRAHRSLFESSWLSFEGEDDSYRMLRPLRSFVLTRGPEQIWRQHVLGLTQMLKRIAEQHPNSEEVRHTVERHYADLLLALKLAVADERLNDQVSEILQYLNDHWLRRNLLLDAAGLYELVKPKLSGVPLLQMEMMQGILAYRQNLLDTAETHFQRALELSRTLGHVRGEGAALANLGLLYSYSGQCAAAVEALEESVSVLRAADDPFRLSNALYNAAQALVNAAEAASTATAAKAFVNRAAQYVEEGLSLGVEDRMLLQSAFHMRARIHFFEGDHGAAEFEFRRAIGICVEADMPHETIEGLIYLAKIAYKQRAYERSANIIGIARGMLTAAGHGVPGPELEQIAPVIKQLRRELGTERCRRLIKFGERLSPGDLDRIEIGTKEP
jgi:serine/threonine-protein kinase PknK